MSDQVKDQAREVGGETIEHGKELAQAAAETAKETGPEHASDLQGAVRESARETVER